MKKIILLTLTVLTIGCENIDSNGHIKLDDGCTTSFLIDSCEYISWGYGIAHKGNCYFCEERRQKELKYIIEQLKEN